MIGSKTKRIKGHTRRVGLNVFKVKGHKRRVKTRLVPTGESGVWKARHGNAKTTRNAPPKIVRKKTVHLTRGTSVDEGRIRRRKANFNLAKRIRQYHRDNVMDYLNR